MSLVNILNVCLSLSFFVNCFYGDPLLVYTMVFSSVVRIVFNFLHQYIHVPYVKIFGLGARTDTVFDILPERGNENVGNPVHPSFCEVG